MRALTLDPQPDETLRSLWDRNQTLADAVENALDWIEADPPDPRAKRRRFSNGMWVVQVHAAGEDWTIVWDAAAPDEPVVRLIAETTSI